MSQDYPPTVTRFEALAALHLLATSFQIAQAVYVAARLGVADVLASGPQTADELARLTGTHAPSLSRLLRALTVFAVLDEVAPGQFALAPMGECLRGDAPYSGRDVVLTWGSEHFWQTAADMLHCVQTGESAMRHLFGADAFDYYRDHPELGATMNAGWAAMGHVRAQSVVDAYDFAASRVVVDVGGNRGQLLAPILRAHPALRGMLFDLPHVVEDATSFVERAGVADRCQLIGGDMFAEVPSGGDTYLLSCVIHDWEDERAGIILRNCRRAMAPTATLLLVERVVPTTLDHSLFTKEAVNIDLTMLLRTGGCERTVAEYTALLATADLAIEELLPTQAGYSIIKSTATSAPSA